MKKIITYQCPICGYISDKDYDVCPACNNVQTVTTYTATFTMPDSAELLKK